MHSSVMPIAVASSLDQERSSKPLLASQELLIKEARQRQRRHRMVWFAGSISAIAAALAGTLFLVTGTGGPSGSSNGPTAALNRGIVGLPRESLQVRPVVRIEAGHPCRQLPITSILDPNQPLRLPWPGSASTCIELGGAVLAADSVKAIEHGTAPGGLPLLTVIMKNGQAERLYEVGAPNQKAFYGIVILGRVLSVVPGGALDGTTVGGRLDIADGDDANDSLPTQLAHVLDSPLRLEPKPPKDNPLTVTD